MKIKTIFVDKLFTFHWEEETENEFDRLMELWTNMNYLTNFALKNNLYNIKKFVADCVEDAELIQDLLAELTETKKPLKTYFQPLSPTEYTLKPLSLQKGKTRKCILRVYAIKIDEDCFVITGGAIKMGQTMQDHPDTYKELRKLKNARHYLQQNRIADSDSFYELLNETP